MASARSTTSTRFRASGRRASSSCATSCRRDRSIERGWPTLLVLAACVGHRARERRARACDRPRASSCSPPAAAASAPRDAPAGLRARARSSPAGGGAACGSTRSTAACSQPEIGRSAAATVVVTGPVRKTPFALRVPAEVRRFGVARAPRASPARAPRRPLAAAGRHPRPAGTSRRSSRRGGRLRRTRLAGAPRRPRRAPRRRLADRRPARRDRRRLRPAPCACCARDRPWARAASGARCSRGSCSARTRGSRTSSATTSRPPGSTTCSPSRDRTSRSSRSACSASPGCSGSPGSAAEVVAIAAIAAYVLAVGWQPSVVRAGVAGGLASLAWLLVAAARPLALPRPRRGGPARLDAGVPARAGLPALLRGRRRDLPARCRGSGSRSRAIRCRPGCATRSRSRPPAERQRRRSSGSSSGASRSTRCSRTRSSTLAIGPLLGLALVGSLVEPVLPSAALALAWVNGWLAAYIAACARLVAGLPLAQIGSGKAVCVLLGDPARPARAAAAAAVAAAGGAGVRCDRRARRSSSGSSCRRRRCRRRPGSASRSSTSARATRSCCRLPEGAMLVDEGPPEANVAQQLRDARRAAAGRGRPHASAARPHRRCRGRAPPDCASSACSIRTWRDRVRTSTPPWPKQRSTASRSSRRGQETRSGSAGCASACSGRIGRERASEDPNLLAIVLLATYGEVDALLTADAETDVTAPLLSRRIEILKVAHHGSADAGLASELRELRPDGRGDLVRPRTTTTATRGLDLAALRAEPGAQPLPHRQDGRVVVESDGKRITVRTGVE